MVVGVREWSAKVNGFYGGTNGYFTRCHQLCNPSVRYEIFHEHPALRLDFATLLMASSHCVLGLPHAGSAVEIAGPRVVCVSKQINEFMYDIHAESVLVARDLTSIYPAAITKLPSVGYHRALSAEGIISMRPTMLLTDGNLGPDAVVTQVKKVGIPVLVLAPGSSADSAQLLMQRLVTSSITRRRRTRSSPVEA